MEHPEERHQAASQGLLGAIGHLQVGVRGVDVPGEVELVVGGAPELYVAYAPDPLPAGTRVLVVSERRERAVDVEAWDL